MKKELTFQMPTPFLFFFRKNITHQNQFQSQQLSDEIDKSK